MMAVRVPFNPSVQVGEARHLIELLRAGIERAESGEKLPAFPKPVRARERKAGE